MLLAAIIGSYTLIGGIGATFYVYYFNTGFIIILILLLIVEVKIVKLERDEFLTR